MNHHCPRCHSSRIDTKNLAKRAVGTLGTLAGAASGVAGFLKGAKTGWKTSLIIGPIGQPYSSIAGAIIGGIIGGTSGCALGVSFGEIVDDTVLNNCVCLACGHTFGANRFGKQSVPCTASEKAFSSSTFCNDDLSDKSR